ncbi:RNA polymerase factor sigma-54 [Kaistia geumhonensis]|uniref:RNA polymerase sigma-54 factor n=1 Tax=Kaistia geumhonensis TaxID=410839 RepID=A0ABU0M6A4_9HYPH|nr:RNA polymerase factor sigma-54 [Kaistia geumhonensis]MCX5478292.1 RNA polymerase factor sigma-54 [Kaistia geumhonensis]MDQ0516491.1 RNA polymerase sigma-54 factor [Kaistia geumhonensis]
MSLSPKLEFRQTQSLVMTPQLMQAIKLLQLSNLDLISYVEAELERNPLLERDEREDGDDIVAGPGKASIESDGFAGDDAGGPPEAYAGERDGAEGEAGDWAEAGGGGSQADWLETRLEVSPDAIADRLDTDLSNVFPDDHGHAGGDPSPQPAFDPWASQPGRQQASSEDYNLEAFVAGEKSLADHLADQLGLAVTDPTRLLIGHALIDEVDEAGYIRADLGAIAERLGAPMALVEEVLATLQGFEPTGICARDLAECLALQLAEKNRLDPAIRALLDHLDLVARRDFAALKRVCGCNEDDIVDMLAELRALDPKPGASFGSAPVQPIVPDVMVRAAPDGSWLIELNTETLPRVLVNNSYLASVPRGSRPDAERAYLAECLQTANWLVKSLDQRAKTILKVATEIVRQQDGFLTHGVRHLRPLNLKTVAEAIGMHESTVSRVTSNKYMATSRGIFELKYFFTSAIASSEGGEAHSAEAVRHRIRTLIDAESADDVLSDDTLVKLLRDAGIDIARRTVAKYREALRIPSSVQRRREKQADLSANR